jgi:hypothetical protein
VKEPKAVKNFLESRLGKELDLNCGGLSISGKVVKIEGGVVLIEKEDVICYVNIEKIIAVWDVQDKKSKMPGFLSTSANTR